MTRTDTFVVGTLVVLLALIAGLIAVPALQPATPTSPIAGATPLATPLPAQARIYREGVLSAPVSASPLTARTQADRDLVALVFSGLVRNGPGGTIVPDLASRWSVDDSGTIWTVELREDARWHDGEPVVAGDVVYTIHTLQDPAYSGPATSSWTEVSVRAESERVVTFTLKTPLGGFLQALTQPIAPSHILAEVPIDLLPDHPFGQQPIGSGPFSLVELTEAQADLVPATPPLDDALAADPSAAATDSLTTAPPTPRPERPLPYLDGIELHFYTDPEALAADYRAGDLDAASGLNPALATELGATDGSRLLRYPGSTLTTVLLNLRPSHAEFRDPKVRTALLAGIDRAAIIDGAYSMSAATASGPIPPASPLFDPAADPPVAFDIKAATKALEDAKWTKEKDGWHLPKAKKALSLEVLSPTAGTNPGLFAAAAAVAADWTELGFKVTHTALPPGEFVTDRLSTGDFQVAVVDVTIGLDPDLYALLASSQTLTGGSNVVGIQDTTLDDLLVKARKPGTDEERQTAYSALQKQLAKGRYLLPLAFADEVVVVRDSLEGPVLRQVTDPSDRFWDVLTWRLAVDR
ncbi:MAG TPA: peptide ABC transporter substrate-binding protein [Candidatus Saccharimonadales bacterium]|nr:peptide ABC transporter substrate-binding protein [Candidatus Saccharimonadales bacterium]